MRRIVEPLVAILLAGLLVSCGGPRSGLDGSSRSLQARPLHYGIALPYPKAFPPHTRDTLPSVVGAEILVPLHLLVDAKGKVKAVTAESAPDSAFALSSSRFLRKLKFVPGLRNGRRDSVTVRVILQIGGTGKESLVRFPVDVDGSVLDGVLYWTALAKLGYQPARLRRFPSYYCQVGAEGKWRAHNYKLFRVDLDSTGYVVGIEHVSSTFPDFDDQLRSAINWAEYEPMTIDNQPVASTNFLVVLMLPTVEYPTSPVDFDLLGTYNIWDRLRVRLTPDTLGVMAPPIPKREWATTITNTFLTGMIPEPVSGRIRIDTSGVGRIDKVAPSYWKARRLLHLNALEKPFFPALDFSGRRSEWGGLVILKYTSDSTTQVWFDWDLSD